MNSYYPKIRRSRPSLGTFVEISVRAPEDAAQEAVSAAFRHIAHLEHHFSHTNEASELSYLNREAYKGPIGVSPWMYEVLWEAEMLSIHSRETFDITEGTGLSDQCCCRSGRGVQLLTGRRVRFRDETVRINVAGIAKGYIVDQAVALLEEMGVSSGVVNAGGDMRAFGEESAHVEIRHPLSPGAFPLHISLRNGALANSAHYYGSVFVDGEPREAASQVLAVGVQADRCLVADALTKVVMLRGQEASSLLERYDAKAYMISPYKKGALQESAAELWTYGNFQVSTNTTSENPVLSH